MAKRAQDAAMVWFGLLVRFNSGVVAADPRWRARQVIEPDGLRDVFDRTLATPDMPAAQEFFQGLAQ